MGGDGVRRGGVSEVRRGDPGYPRPLECIFDPPEILWVEGAADRTRALGGLAVAVVGARDATPQGLAVARSLGRGLAEHGVTVVSGLALGIDAAAHAGALEGGGTTVAVVGGGTDVVYPWRNRGLRAAVLDRGLVVGEWPPGTRPRRHYFPMRNRIISGLSLGVVVVEATARSGALVTARAALEQGREVFAVPGLPGAPRSSGPHRLLKEGAALVETVHDILDELPRGVWVPPPEDPAADPAPALRLLDEIARGAGTVDALTARTGMKIEEIWALLLDLEVRGRVVRQPGGRIALGAPAWRGRVGPGGGGLDGGDRRRLTAPPEAKEERWRRTS